MRAQVHGGPTSDISGATLRSFHAAWFGFISLHLLLSSPAWSVVGVGFLNPSSEVFRWASILALPVAVAAALNPGRYRLALVALVLWSATKLDALPLMPNHITLALVISGLYGYCLVAGGRRGDDPDRALAAFRTVVPVIRISVVVFYLLAALHKCNNDFFDPEVSCGTEMYRELTDVIPILPAGTLFDWAAIIGTFSLELLIPVLLLIPRFRLAGVLIGMPFHVVLAVHPNVYVLSFTVMLFAVYVLFLPAGLVASLEASVSTAARRITALVRARSGERVVVGLLAALVLVWIVAASSGWLPSAVPESARLATCAVLVGVWLVVAGRAASSPALRSPSERIVPRRSATLVLVPLLVATIGLAPYLGLKTTGTFSMFSNLRIEEGANNHWLMPAGLQTSALLGDTVQVVESSDGFLSALAENDDRLPAIALWTYLDERTGSDLTVSFVRDGQMASIVLPRDAAAVEAEAPHWLIAKFLTFRPIPPPGPNRCQW